MSASARHTLTEIMAQPQSWRATLDAVQAWMARLPGGWPPAGPAEVLFTGCGSPFYLAQSAAAVYRGLTGQPARALPGSELILFPQTVFSPGCHYLQVVISRTGQTTEVLEAVEQFRRHSDGRVIAITCRENSDLGTLADLTLVMPDAAEQSLAQTRSFSSMLVTTHALSHALAGRPLTPAFMSLPDLGQAVLDAAGGLMERLGGDAGLERFFFLGNGPFYGLATEGMLKMKEMALSYSEAYHFLEFRHGPMSMVNNQALVVGLVSGTALNHEVAVLSQMRTLGGRVLALTPVALAPGLVDEQVVLPGGLSDWERGPLYMPALQLLGFHRAIHKGLDPDLPQNLNAFVKLDMEEIAGRRLTAG